MDQKKSSITLAQAFEGMILSKQAEGKSLNTINDYRNSFRKLALYLDSNRTIDAISKSYVVSFFAWLQEDYESELVYPMFIHTAFGIPLPSITFVTVETYLGCRPC